MTINIGTNQAAFAAYTKLSLVSRFENRRNNVQTNIQPKTSMKFSDFMECLQKNEIVNNNYVRKMPEKQREDSLINRSYNGNLAFENQKLSFIEKAYNLGMVNSYNTLINTKV